MLKQNSVSLQPYNEKFLFTADGKVRNTGAPVCVPSFKLEKLALLIMLPNSLTCTSSSEIVQINFTVIN